ncbi:endopeptidase [Myxococcus landrumensis]|uniref:Endopeptidase n=1 Tax=Myxococcus landrumensis TaxID=2813577 RepID=A0ABX7NFR4_9BACT|nr:endopeptidase [Myxococcus landrumus]QSQ16339.1 endopeptidase [Myxococcus landrumus]
MRHTKVFAACCALLLSAPSWAVQQPAKGQSAIADKAFFKPEFYLPIQNTPLDQAMRTMAPGTANGWDEFFARNGKDFRVHIDPRTGSPSGVEGPYPLIPGDGFRNQVSMDGVRESIGRSVANVDESVIGELVVKFVADNATAFNVDLMQLGSPRVTRVTEQLWHVHIPQQVNGIPVRHARIAAVISHGNLILIGTESWANVAIDTRAGISPMDALSAGNSFTGLTTSAQQLWQQPELELVPTAPQGESFAGAVGTGYSHVLAYTYGVQDPVGQERWKLTVDASTGETLAIEDDNHYFDAQITGGIYPSTNIGTCADNTVCGSMKPNSPMPWANTSLAAPNNFTDGAGVYNFSTGTATTTLSGKYVRVSDGCGAISNSSTTGNIDLGGVNNTHDCTSIGSAGNTPASRSSFYELNKLAEQARGYLPNNTWLQSQLLSNVNIQSTCNAFWNGSSVNFYRTGGGCRNTGEIGAVFDHEWGHGLDDFDTNGTLSNSSEGYADIAAIYRLQTSCVGYGFFDATNNLGCGTTPDGTGANQQESQVSGYSWCNTRCSGVRDADYGKATYKTPSMPSATAAPPATPQNFTCPMCSAGSGPCSKQVHCAASPARQAAWDLVTRDLTAAPFNYDSNTAYIVGNKVFYQGSGNIGAWHSCNCSGGTSDGCGATNGYMSWLAADDDNGNLGDGTPHMTAIHSAFNRHNIACNTTPPVNSGCSGGPTAAPTHTATAGDGQVALNWTASAGASEYWVMRTEGMGCDFGKAKIATVSGTTYTDTEVANNREYCYSIVPASSNACYGAASTCSCAKPACTPPGGASLTTPANGAVGAELATALDWADVSGASTYEVQVATDAAFTNVVASANSLVTSNWTISPALNVNTTYYWRVRAGNSCGGTGSYSAAFSFTTRGCVTLAAPTLSSPADGATGVATSAALDWSDVPSAARYIVEVATDAAFTNIVRSNTTLTTSAWTVSPALNSATPYYWRARAADVCSESPNSTARSFTTTTVCTPVQATYDATRRAPTCGSVCGCDTGPTLVKGRGTMSGGVESNQPNTIGASCADGVSGTYQSDESIDRVVIKTVDQGPFAAGKQVTVEVTVWCWGTTDAFDLYYTSNAATPAWTALTTNQACTTGGVARTFTHTFNLAATAGTHAIRPQFRYGGTASSCTAGSYNDRDDMVFSVGAAVAATGSGKSTTAQGRPAPAGR